jgi:hypothetical protein
MNLGNTLHVDNNVLPNTALIDVPKLVTAWGACEWSISASCTRPLHSLQTHSQRTRAAGSYSRVHSCMDTHWREVQSTWKVHYHLAYWTSRGWLMMMTVDRSVEWLAGETEVPGENLPQSKYIYYKSHMSWPGIEPWTLGWDYSDEVPQFRQGLTCLSPEILF